MTTEAQDNSLQPAAVAPARRKSWREQRWERRRRRHIFEEILGWILVPLIVIACYRAVDGALGALGTSPAALIQGIQTIIANH